MALLGARCWGSQQKHHVIILLPPSLESLFISSKVLGIIVVGVGIALGVVLSVCAYVLSLATPVSIHGVIMGLALQSNSFSIPDLVECSTRSGRPIRVPVSEECLLPATIPADEYFSLFS